MTDRCDGQEHRVRHTLGRAAARPVDALFSSGGAEESLTASLLAVFESVLGGRRSRAVARRRVLAASNGHSQ